MGSFKSPKYLGQAVGEAVGEMLEGLFTKEIRESRYQSEVDVREFVEHIVVDFAAILKEIRNYKKRHAKPVTAYYEQLFYRHWREKAPPDITTAIDFGLRDDVRSIRAVSQAILAMGAKLKSVLAGLCVAHSVDLKCDACYFRESCKIKR